MRSRRASASFIALAVISFCRSSLDKRLLSELGCNNTAVFYRSKTDEYKDSSPELYFTDEEKDIGDTIIKNHAPDGFGTLLLSNRFKEDRDVEFIRKVLYKNKLPYFYYVKDPSFLSLFDVNTAFDLRNVAIRVQMYIKTQAKVMVGSMSGADIMFPRYTNVYMAPKEGGFGNNFVRGNLVTKIEDI